MKTCSTEPKIKMNKEPVVYTKPRNRIVELCEYYEIELGTLYIYDYIIGFDLEAINLVYNLPENKEPSNVLQFTSKQIPLSFSTMSNLDGYNTPHFFWSKDSKDIVVKIFDYFDEVQKKSNDLMMNKLKPLLDKISEHPNQYTNKHLEEVTIYCSSIPIVGFNSGGYDINSMLEYGFLDEILKRDPEHFNLNNGKRYKAIKTKQFTFLDEMLYCASGTTLDKFLKCFSKSKDDHKFHVFL